MHEPESPWLWLVLGVLLVGLSLFSLIALDGVYEWRGVRIPLWAVWLLIPCGLLAIAFSIWALCHGQRGPHYTDEEIARAKAELDAMYLREHGELPQKPTEDEDEK